MQEQQQNSLYKWHVSVFSKREQICKLHVSITISLLLA